MRSDHIVVDPAMQLQTERLLLRLWEPDDWPAVRHYTSDPEVIEFIPWGPNAEPAAKDFIRRSRAQYTQREQQHFDLAAVEVATGEVVGGGGLHITSFENREASISYTLRRASWGRGYATELTRRLLVFGFEELRLHRVFATCDPRNQRSQRVLEKVGMVQEGRLRENVWMRGTWRDSLVFAVLEGDVRRE